MRKLSKIFVVCFLCLSLLAFSVSAVFGSTSETYESPYTEFNKTEGNASHYNVTLMEDGSHSWYGHVYFNVTGTLESANPPQTYLCDHASNYESGNSVLRCAMNTTWIGVQIIANGTDIVVSDEATFSAKSSPNDIRVKFENYGGNVSVTAYDNWSPVATVSYNNTNYQNVTFFGASCSGGGGSYTDGNVYLSFRYYASSQSMIAEVLAVVVALACLGMVMTRVQKM